MKQASSVGVDWLWFLGCALASSVWCVTAATQLSATFDEPIYIVRGLDAWRSGSHGGLMKLGTMPLPVDVVTLPLFIAERWRGVQFDTSSELVRLLPWARAATLVFWWLLLFYAWRAGRVLAGAWAGRLAVALIAGEPTMLAHASLATTDIAVTACLLALVYHFRTARDAAWPRRVAVPTLWYAATVLAKASGLVYGPLCLLAVSIFKEAPLDTAPEKTTPTTHEPETDPANEFAATKGTKSPCGDSPRPLRMGRGSPRRWASRLSLPRFQPPGWRDGSWTLQAGSRRYSSRDERKYSLKLIIKPFGRDLAQIVGGGLVLVFLYCGSDWRTEPSFIAWAQGLPDSSLRAPTLWLAEHLRIFSNAGEGLARQIKHNLRGPGGHWAYLLGAQQRSFWYYFPVALSLKLSAPLLALPLLVGVLRPRALWNWANVAAAALLLFSLTARVQIGVRLALPIVALAAVGLAASVVETCRSFTTVWARHACATAAAVGVACTAAAAVAVWPNGLSNINSLWGGSERGYLYVSDSNYDWGQGLLELARWQTAHGGGTLDVWYFGTDPRVDSPPLKNLRLHIMPIVQPPDVLTYAHGRLAVSTTFLYGTTITEAQQQAAAFLRALEPMGRTTTFFIYDLSHATDPPALAPPP